MPKSAQLSRRARLGSAWLPVLAATALGACGGQPTPPAPIPTAVVPASAATPAASVRQVVTADGAFVLPVPPQALAFPVASTVLDVAVRPGDRVVDGQELARIDVLPLDRLVAEAEAAVAAAQDRLDQLLKGADAADEASARAEVDGAQAALARLESGAALTSARLEIERARNGLWGAQAERDSVCGLAEAGIARQSQCDAAQASVQSAEAAVRIAEQNLAATDAAASGDLAAARARLAAAQARLGLLRSGASPGQIAAARAQLVQTERALDQARADYARASLRAPFDGVVESVHVTEGVRAAPGVAAITVVQVEPLHFATTNLSERNVALVAEGAAATVTLAAFPDEPLEARVLRIAPQSSPGVGGTTTFTVYLEVDNPRDWPLRAGMTGRAEIDVAGGAR